MTLSEELSWRGFVNQTTYKSLDALDGPPITFYFGVDPSADSMTVGNLAAAMMVRHFVSHGHQAILLVGGATGLIGDPDGKANERDLQTLEDVERNKQKIAAQYRSLFNGQPFKLVDNYDWFKDFGYLDFLRTIGKHVPLSQMLARDFVQSRLGETGSGISYAEFSYALIQAYDFLYLHKEHGANLQVCGADQWGNCIAGVDLIRRVTGDETHVWSAPLVINKVTGVKFGKSEDGAVWLDPSKTSPTKFYQFWINCDDEGVEGYLKVYSLLTQDEISEIMSQHRNDPGQRLAQKSLASAVTELVHGQQNMKLAQAVTDYLTAKRLVSEASEEELASLRTEIAHVKAKPDDELAAVLSQSGLVSSKTEARRLQISGGIYINGIQAATERLGDEHFINGKLLIRRGKRFEDSALVELG